MSGRGADDLFDGKLSDELTAAARNAARICLDAREGEVATLITDEATSTNG